LNTATATTIPGDPVLRRETDGAVAVLTLNRPASRNSLSEAMLTELIDALAAIGRDTSIRAVIIAAEGPAFCSGHDLKELTGRRTDPDGGRGFFTRLWSLCGTMMMSVVRPPRPRPARRRSPAASSSPVAISRSPPRMRRLRRRA